MLNDNDGQKIQKQQQQEGRENPLFFLFTKDALAIEPLSTKRRSLLLSSKLPYRIKPPPQTQPQTLKWPSTKSVRPLSIQVRFPRYHAYWKSKVDLRGRFFTLDLNGDEALGIVRSIIGPSDNSEMSFYQVRSFFISLLSCDSELRRRGVCRFKMPARGSTLRFRNRGSRGLVISK